MRRNNKLIVIISIVLVLAVASAVLGYLYFATDTFKSTEELFAKYIQQNTDMIKKALDFQTIEVYEDLKNQNIYESNTNIKMIHSEGGEVSNPLNNLSAQLKVQKNNDEQYFYADAQILYENEEYLEAEVIREEDTYGIRFTDAVKQFITVKNDENLEAVAEDIGIEKQQLQMLINGSEQLVSKEEMISLKDKYLNIIIEEMKKGTFQKQKDAMITYNNSTINTNAYSISLTNKQVEELLLQLLNNIKQETAILEKLDSIISKEKIIKQIDQIIENINEELEVPTIKVTVYEQKQKTIRTCIEIGTDKITIDNIEQIEGTKTKINYSKLTAEKEVKYQVEINKKNAENNEEIEINVNVINGENEYTITILGKMQLRDNKIELDIEGKHEQEITTISVILENDISIGNDFEKAEVLKSANNILMNSLEKQKRISLMNVLKKLVSEKTNERIKRLEEKFGITNQETEGTVTPVEINKFNSKFEFYTGDEVSAENVKMLLEIVKNNLKSYEINTDELDENETNTDLEVPKVKIKLNIENNKVNEDAINKVLEKIDDNKKYKVGIFYKETNGIIDYITITEI